MNRSFYLLVLSLLACLPAHAQNLLTNPGFTSFTQCTYSGSNIDSCIGWARACVGTPDYYNKCSGYPVGVPDNFAGNQASGDSAYAGIYTFINQSMVAPDYKEYMTTSFLPLEPGVTYSVTITVSLADLSYFVSDGLGVYFSTARVPFASVSTLPVTPQIDYSSYGMLSDYTNWVKLTKTFVADSAYTWLTIGSFKDTAATSFALSPLSSSATLDSAAYYYIDSVSVQKAVGSGIGVATSTAAGRVFPSPFSSSATLTFNYLAGEQYSLELYDMQGRLLRTMEQIQSGRVVIERNGLEPGCYLYRLSCSRGLVGVNRFIIN